MDPARVDGGDVAVREEAAVRASLARMGVWALGWVVAGGLVSRVEPLGYERSRARDAAGREARNRSALAEMLGGFRTSASDLMYIRTERYMHGGVAFRHGAEGAEPDGEEHDVEHEHDHGHEPGVACAMEGAETAIPRKEKDFRGWVGDLYREVKPWRDPAEPHVHTDGKELLPWFRIMTLSDPHHVQGYLAGAFWLQKEDPEAALQFVEEGVRNNPDAFALRVSRGMIRMKQVRGGGGEAVAEADRPLLEAAREDFLRGATLGLAQRPSGGEAAGGEWGRYEENDLLTACRMTVFLEERLGDAEAAGRHRERFAVMGPLFPEEGHP